MSIDTIKAHPQATPDVGDDLREIKERIPRRHVSDWTRIDAAASHSFQHGLDDIPYIVSVLESADSQGSGATEATSVTVTSTVTVTTVANGGTARFFRVRAM